MFGALKNEGERVTKRLVCSQPNEFVGSRYYGTAKFLKVGVVDFRVQAIAGDNHIGIGKAGADIIQLNLLLKMQSNAQLARPLMQKLQEALSA